MLAGPAVWLDQARLTGMARAPPAHSPPTQPVAGTTLGSGGSLLKIKSGCVCVFT